MPLLSDWDLDAAFLKSHNMSVVNNSEPCLCLRVDLKPFEEYSDEWHVRQNVPQIRSNQEVKSSPRLQGIFNQVGKTLNMVQRALNIGEDGANAFIQPPRPPLSDAEFRKFLDPVGQIGHAKELRSVIYFGGIEPSLRKVVWKHLLNVYPDGMTGRERMDYIKKKAAEYVNLRESWKTAIAQGPVVGELAYTTGMVRKDVLRTDRHHPYYAGSDDNQHIASLFNILTTYALNHPKVSYCQGMSDLASPLLVTMDDEAHAYICFCALMERLSTNFMIDGIAMTQKFTHLAEGLMYYDPEFYNYLKIHQADDLLFCYRWLLLEMKREFAFEDSLRMLEVLWSSLPADPPEKELKLYDTQFQPPQKATPPISPLVKTPRENPYTKVCALRRQSSSISLINYSGKKVSTVKRQNHSLDETIGRCKNNILDIKMKHQSLDDATLVNKSRSSETSPKSPSKSPVKSPQKIIKDDSFVKSRESRDLSPKSLKNELRPRSVSPLEQKSDSVLLNNRINSNQVINKPKSASLSSSMTNLIKNNKKAGHFKDLKDKIAAAKLFSSLDRLDSAQSIKEEKPKGKMVKNLNEFLNFASVNKNKISDRLSSLSSIDSTNDKPKILLTKSSFDDSESSSFDRNSSSVDRQRHYSSTSNSCDDTFDECSPDDSQEYFPLTTSVTRELRLELENLDRKVFGDKFIERLSESPSSECNSEIVKTDKETVSKVVELTNQNLREKTAIEEICEKRKSKSDDIFVWENPLHQPSPNVAKTIPNYMPTPDEQIDLEFDDDTPTIVNETSATKTVTPIKIINITQPTKQTVDEPTITQNTETVDETDNCPSSIKLDNINGATNMTNSCEEVTEAIKSSNLLPPPNEFGGGNPFLMFLCITVLLQHREHIITTGMDYNEMAMHFDKMVRKHNVIRVLNQARKMYARYIKQHTIALQKIDLKHEDC
ncbi:uncharacterized protein LOC109605404 isoform X2 [Aethina tumida]|nr:uncharacterized protein LOC109605404 isoform X2 [Aethina tumida]